MLIGYYVHIPMDIYKYIYIISILKVINQIGKMYLKLVQYIRIHYRQNCLYFTGSTKRYVVMDSYSTASQLFAGAFSFGQQDMDMQPYCVCVGEVHSHVFNSHHEQSHGQEPPVSAKASVQLSGRPSVHIILLGDTSLITPFFYLAKII